MQDITFAQEDILEFWRRNLPAGWKEPQIDRIMVTSDIVFSTYYVPRTEDRPPWKYIDFSPCFGFVVHPRYTVHPGHCILIPKSNLVEPARWAMCLHDIYDLLRWVEKTGFAVTVSGYLGGASWPSCFHAQSLPCELMALKDARVKPFRDRGQLPRFRNLEIATLVNYPARGLRISGESNQAAEQTLELAIAWNHLISFNLVMLPSSDGPAIYFFARPKGRSATWGPNSWAVASIEFAGLLQAKTRSEKAAMNKDIINEMFKETSLSESEFETFLQLIDVPDQTERPRHRPFPSDIYRSSTAANQAV